MTLRQTIEEIKTWSNTDQLEFCNLIIKNIPFGIRSILSYKDNGESEKLDAIKWLNEFHHRIHNVKFEIENAASKTNDKIEKIGEHAQFYAGKNKLTAGEIAAIVSISFKPIIYRKTKTS